MIIESCSALSYSRSLRHFVLLFVFYALKNRLSLESDLNVFVYGYGEAMILGRCGVLTRMRPVVVCPDMSSPAQSLASVMNVPSNSCLLWRAAFCSFCLGSLGANSGSFRQQRNAKARHSSTMSSPAKKVNMLDSRKHHHRRICRHSLMLPGGCVTGTLVTAAAAAAVGCESHEDITAT